MLIALLTFVLSLILSNTNQISKIEYAIQDYHFEIRGPLSVENSPIVLVAISEKADSEIPEKWPWPTSVHARLVENLNRAGAKAILFDVLFSQEDRFNPKNDSLFAQSIKKYGNVVLAGDIERIKIREKDEFNPIFPIPLLRENNLNSMGFVSTFPYSDGFVRTYNIGRSYQGNDYFMLGLEGLKLYSGIDNNSIDAFDPNSKESVFTFGEYKIQRDNLNTFIINFYGPEGHFPAKSYAEVIDDTSYTTVFEEEAFETNLFEDPETGEGLLYEEFFKDKIVIVGATMPTLQDFHATPYSTADFPRPGFEIHAHAIQTILDGNYITQQSNALRLVIILAMALIVVFINRSLGPAWGFGLMIVLIAGYYSLSVWAFLSLSVFVNVMGVFLSIFLSQVSTVSYEYLFERKEKRRIKGMFSSYVSPTLVDQMIESGEEPKLGGEDTFMTAFFSDIVSFSTFSEKLEPKQLVTLINEYLTAMTNIINEQGGTLDKFIGDAIVAFYGAPVPIKDHALRACISSQLMEKKLADLRKKWKKDDWPEIVWNMQHRMGMNTGDMVTGNMGSERRFNYTMMGDNVNLAARCESGAKQYNVFTMITESTKNEAEAQGDDCLFRLLDNIVVKGRSKPVKVFEIVGLRKDAPQKMFDCIALYEKGMENYFKQDWDKAIKFFEQALLLEAHLKNPSQLFIERCKMMKLKPPAGNWDGVYIMTSK